MQAIIVGSYEELENSGPGSILLCQNLTGIIMRCPGCSKPGSMHVYQLGSPKLDSPSWEISGLPNNITLYPSINCVGCCKWHGWLKNGVYSSC